MYQLGPWVIFDIFIQSVSFNCEFGLKSNIFIKKLEYPEFYQDEKWSVDFYLKTAIFRRNVFHWKRALSGLCFQDIVSNRIFFLIMCPFFSKFSMNYQLGGMIIIKYWFIFCIAWKWILLRWKLTQIKNYPEFKVKFVTLSYSFYNEKL